MKRLFAVRGKSGLVTLRDVPKSMGYDITHASKDGKLYFDTKRQAKQVRELLNGTDQNGHEVLGNGFTVTYGPDHWRKS